MNEDFAAAMRRATQLTRSRDLTAAMRVIQDALGAQRKPRPEGRSLEIAPPPAGHPKRRLLDPGAELVELDTEPASASSPGQVPESAGQNSPRPSPRPRRPLGDVLRLLREGRGRIGAVEGLLPGLYPGRQARSPRPPIPDGAQFLTRSYSCAAGTRSYKLYVPKSAQGRPAGLVVMLHGCKQDADDFAAGTNMNSLAEAHALLVAYPAQASSANVSACWNWFSPADQIRDAGEPSIIAGITSHLMSEYGLPRQQVFVAGLSAGGAMAAVMGETYPDLYSAVGIHSGLAYGSANDVASAFAAMRGDPHRERRSTPRPTAPSRPMVRTIIFHGRRDAVVHPSNADRIELAARRSFGAEGQPQRSHGNAGRPYERIVTTGPGNAPVVETWLIEGAGHAWSGGDPSGSFTDPLGPDASAEMVRFFLQPPS
jgi:poly(hydroxyalkanoate) depolymerase family esterase